MSTARANVSDGQPEQLGHLGRDRAGVAVGRFGGGEDEVDVAGPLDGGGEHLGRAEGVGAGQGVVGDEDGLGRPHGQGAADALHPGGRDHRHDGHLAPTGLLGQLEAHLHAEAVGLVHDQLALAFEGLGARIELTRHGRIGDLLHADDDVHCLTPEGSGPGGAVRPDVPAPPGGDDGVRFLPLADGAVERRSVSLRWSGMPDGDADRASCACSTTCLRRRSRPLPRLAVTGLVELRPLPPPVLLGRGRAPPPAAAAGGPDRQPGPRLDRAGGGRAGRRCWPPTDEPDAWIAELKTAFLASPWAGRRPRAVERPFVLSAGGTTVRGRVDAVYDTRRPAGGARDRRLQDGAPPGDRRRRRRVPTRPLRPGGGRLLGPRPGAACGPRSGTCGRAPA